MRIIRCGACRRRGHNRSTCPKPRYPGKRWYHGRWRGPDEMPRDRRYHGLDDYILQHVGRVPTPTGELYSRVVNDYGPVGQRTFLRHLRTLRRKRHVKALPGPHPRSFLYTSSSKVGDAYRD